jgi:hypothetical protein
MSRDFGTHLARTSISERSKKGHQPQVVDSPKLIKYPRCDSNAQPLAPEARGGNPQPPINTLLTESEQPVLASCLAQIVQKYPDLKQIVEAWPELPEHIKAAIKALIQSYTNNRSH